MDPIRNDPERIGLEVLARLLLSSGENDPSLILRSSRTIRNTRIVISSEALPAIIGESSAPVILEPINIAAARVVTPDWARGSSDLDDASDMESAHFQPHTTERAKRVWRSSRVARYTLPAAFVVAVCVVLLGKMLSPPRSQSTNALMIAEVASAPAPAPNEVTPHRDAPSAAHVPTPAPKAASPTEHVAQAAQAAMTPEPAQPHDRESSATPSAEQGTVQPLGNGGRSETAVANPHINQVHRPIIKPTVTSRSRNQPATEHLALSAKPVPRVPSGNVPEATSVPQRLLLARAALASRNQSAARSLMEEVQTMIVFQPETMPSSRSSTAASQITAALIMLGHGDNDGALQRLNQAIAAIQPVS